MQAKVKAGDLLALYREAVGGPLPAAAPLDHSQHPRPPPPHPTPQHHHHNMLPADEKLVSIISAIPHIPYVAD